MTNIIFDAAYIARQRKLLSGRAEYDPRIAKFLAALDEIERLNSALESASIELQHTGERFRCDVAGCHELAQQ